MTMKNSLDDKKTEWSYFSSGDIVSAWPYITRLLLLSDLSKMNEFKSQK